MPERNWKEYNRRLVPLRRFTFVWATKWGDLVSSDTLVSSTFSLLLLFMPGAPRNAESLDF